MKRALGITLFLFAIAAGGCGGGGSGSCPEVQDASDAGIIGADSVVSCEGCSSGSQTFTCGTDSLTISCSGGIIEDDDGVAGFASTTDCTEGTVTCFNGANNTSCIDTASE